MRFIGSKVLLLEEIKKVILTNIKNSENLSFCDIFSGTSTVARYFKKDYKILSNDLLYFSYVLQKATIENNSIPKFNKLKETLNINPIEHFNNIEVTMNILNATPFIYENYSPNLKTDYSKYYNSFIQSMGLTYFIDEKSAVYIDMDYDYGTSKGYSQGLLGILITVQQINW